MDMKNKFVYDINAFPLVSFLAKNICEDLGVPVSRVEISKDGQDGSLAMGDNSTLHGVQIEMLNSCVLKSCRSAGRTGLDSKASDALAAAIGIIQLTYGMSSTSEHESSPSLRIDQFPGAFLIAKNILCPVCEFPFFNMPVKIVYNSLVHDAIENDHACINGGMLVHGAIDCALLACLIRHYNGNVKASFTKMLTNRQSSRLLKSIMSEVYESDSDIDSFMSLAIAYADIAGMKEEISNSYKMKKTSSFSAPSFWIFGLIEKMLAPVRGVRDNIAEKWAPISHEVWDRIDERRKEMGLPHAPMEVMLRVQAAPFSDENSSKTLQSKLEDNRSWKIKNRL